MTSGIGFSEILVILTLTVIFVKPKDIPELLRKALKLIARLRAEFKKLMTEIDKI